MEAPKEIFVPIVDLGPEEGKCLAPHWWRRDKSAEYPVCEGSVKYILADFSALLPDTEPGIKSSLTTELEDEVMKYWNDHALEYRLGRVSDLDFLHICARHFAEWGATHLNAR